MKKSPSPHSHLPTVSTTCPIGFNGYLLDKISGCYFLGNGYRLYNPRLRSFYSPDSLSPFGVAGPNRYQYCGLDPINFVDPSGHLSWQAGVGIGLGVLGILMSVFTLGSSIALLGAGSFLAGGFGVTSGVLGLASASTGIASAALEESDPSTSAALGWASLGLGVGSLVTGIGASFAARSAAAAATRQGSVRTWGTYVRDNQNIKGINFFEDSNRFGPRLNISAHGTYGDGAGYLVGGRRSAVVEFFKGPKYYNADDVYGMIATEYTGPKIYSHIRVLACHSADGGANSFGQRLSNLSRMKVTGYLGEMHTTPLEPVIGEFMHVLKNTPGRSYNPVLFRPI